METPQCPTCRREITTPQPNKHRPFCSDRCKLADLSRWLDEEYSFSRPISMLDMADAN